MRPFGKGQPFDNVITLIGGILSKGVVGATPFFSTVFSMAAILIVHKMLAKLSVYSKWFGAKVKGEKILLFKEGAFIKRNMNYVDITEKDIMEDLRLTVKSDSLDGIKEAYMERSGEISFVKKEV